MPIGVPARPALIPHVQQGYPCLQHLAHLRLDALEGRTGHQLGRSPPQTPVPRDPAPSLQRVVQPHLTQFGVQHGHGDRRAGQESVQHRQVRPPPARLCHVGGQQQPAASVRRLAQGTDPQTDVHPVAVGVPGGQQAAPVTLGLAPLDRRVDRHDIHRLVENEHGMLAHHLLRCVTEQPLRRRAPTGDCAPPVEHRRRERWQRERVLARKRGRCLHCIHHQMSYPRHPALSVPVGGVCNQQPTHDWQSESVVTR